MVAFGDAVMPRRDFCFACVQPVMPGIAECAPKQKQVLGRMNTCTLHDFGFGRRRAEAKVAMEPAQVPRERKPLPEGTVNATCGVCGRGFKTDKGLAMQKKQVHPAIMQAVVQQAQTAVNAVVDPEAQPGQALRMRVQLQLQVFSACPRLARLPDTYIFITSGIPYTDYDPWW